MPRCSAVKPNGERCERIVKASHLLCYSHDPERQEERKASAIKAATVKSNGELAGVKSTLELLYREIRTGKVEPKKGGVLVQCLNTEIRALDLEHRQTYDRENLVTRGQLAVDMQAAAELMFRHLPDEASLKAFKRELRELAEQRRAAGR